MKNDSDSILYQGWNEWSSDIKGAIVTLAISLFSVFYAIVIGLVTLLVYAFKQIKRFVVAYPVPVLSFLCAVLLLCILFVFVSYSAKLKTCQMELDSVAYEKAKLEQAFVGDTIIVRGYSKHLLRDTIFVE